MKNILIFITTTVFLSITPLWGQNKKEIREKNLKSIKIFEKKTELSKEQILRSYTLFDDHGNILEEAEYNGEGETKMHKKYEYDQDDNKIKEIELSPQGKILSTTIFKYENKLRTEKTEYDYKGKMKSVKTYVYEKF